MFCTSTNVHEVLLSRMCDPWSWCEFCHSGKVHTAANKTVESGEKKRDSTEHMLLTEERTIVPMNPRSLCFEQNQTDP